MGPDAAAGWCSLPVTHIPSTSGQRNALSVQTLALLTPHPRHFRSQPSASRGEGRQWAHGCWHPGSQSFCAWPCSILGRGSTAARATDRLPGGTFIRLAGSRRCRPSPCGFCRRGSRSRERRSQAVFDDRLDALDVALGVVAAVADRDFKQLGEAPAEPILGADVGPECASPRPLSAGGRGRTMWRRRQCGR